MRYVCPKDVKKMLSAGISGQQSTLAMLRKKTKKDWTAKHRNVARKLVLEEGWVQKKLFDIGWSDASESEACHKEEGSDWHRLYHCPEWHEVRRRIPDAFRVQAKKREPERRSGSGKEVLLRILSVKANGIGVTV